MARVCKVLASSVPFCPLRLATAGSIRWSVILGATRAALCRLLDALIVMMLMMMMMMMMMMMEDLTTGGL